MNGFNLIHPFIFCHFFQGPAHWGNCRIRDGVQKAYWQDTQTTSTGLFECRGAATLLWAPRSLTWLFDQGYKLVVSNFFLLWSMEAAMLLVASNAAEIFLYMSPNLCLDTILTHKSTDSSFSLMAEFSLWHPPSAVRLHLGSMCLRSHI